LTTASQALFTGENFRDTTIVGPDGPCVVRRFRLEVKMANLAEVLRNALSLEVPDRAVLAERLLV
jgi:hypothetical protein